MGAPASQGRLCTTLEEMEIGDYIRCTYMALTADAMGIFDGFGKIDALEAELPLRPGATAEGYFYFLKVCKGLLIADRQIQQISAAVINSAGYLVGKSIGNSIIRCLSNDEWIKYIVEGDCGGCITKQDKNVWNITNLATTLPRGAHTVYPEIVQNIAGQNVGLMANLNGAQYSDEILYCIPKYVSQAAVSFRKWIGIDIGYRKEINSVGVNIEGYTAFRPALEYIDNKKSKTIWY